MSLNVEYIDHMGSDLTVTNAARVSFDKHKEVFDAKDERLISYLARENHFTPFAHPQITVRVTAPVFVARQLQKHVVGLVWSEVSRRYVDDSPEFYMPKSWRGRPTDGAKQGSSDEVIDVAFNGQFGPECKVDMIYEGALKHAQMAYEYLLESGVAPEQARMILPQSMYTSWYWTGSLAAFARVCKLRLDSHAQSETRDVAKMIADIIEPLFPVSFKALIND